MTDDEIRKLLADATPGPWERAGAYAVNAGGKTVAVCNWSPTRDLVAASPELAAEVLRLRACIRAVAAQAESRADGVVLELVAEELRAMLGDG